MGMNVLGMSECYSEQYYVCYNISSKFGNKILGEMKRLDSSLPSWDRHKDIVLAIMR